MTMRSAAECLVQAADMERRARLCAAPNLQADLLSMAQDWRYVAQLALWQDAFVSVSIPVLDT
jgi:hypothetical protein